MRLKNNLSLAPLAQLLLVCCLLGFSQIVEAQRIAAGLNLSAVLNLNTDNACGIQVSVSSNLPSCEGNTVCLAVIGGLPPYKIYVDGQYHSSSLLGLAVCLQNLHPGDHVIKITDALGCTADLNVDIPSINDLLRPVIKPVSCHGMADGSITLDLSLLVGIDLSTLVCRWEGPDDYHGEGRSIHNLRPGRYSVRILAIGNICIGTSSWEVPGSSAEPIKINISIANAACGTANACAYISGGKPPYRIWGFHSLPGTATNANFLDFVHPDGHRVEDCTVYNPSTTNSPFCINELSAGYYYILVQDANGCYGWQVFKVNPSARFQRSLSVQDISCHGEKDGKICFEIQGSAPPYKTTLVSTSANNIQTMEGKQGCFEHLSAGEYVLTTTDGSGCISGERIKIMEPTELEAAFVLETNNCQDGASGCLKINGGTRPYRVFAWFYPSNNVDVEIGWQNDGTPYVQNAERCNYFNFPPVWSATSAFCARNLPPGKYILLVIDAHNCFEKIVVEIPPLDNLQAKFERSIDLCSPWGSGCLTIEGGTQPYKVFVFKTNSVLAVIPTLRFDATGRPHLSNCESTEWQWSTPGIAPPYQICTSDIPPGFYWILVLDKNGCYKLLPVNIPPANAIQLKTRVENVTCNGEKDGKIYLTIEGGEAPYTIYLNGNATSNSPTSNRLNFTLDHLSAGIYKIEVKDKNGCSAWSEVKITEPAPLHAVFVYNQNDPCNGETGGCVRVQGGIAPYRIRFLRPNASNAEVTVRFNVATNNFDISGAVELNIQLNPPTTTTNDWCIRHLPPGNYVILVSDKNGCYTLLPIRMDEPDNLRLDAEVFHAACNAVGGNIKLRIKGGEAPFQVKLGDRSISTSDSIVWLENVPPGTYTLYVSDERGCTAELKVVVKLEAIKANLDFDKFGEWACVHPSGGTAPYKIEWKSVADNQFISNDTCINDLNPGVYLVTIFDQSGCSVQHWIVIDPQPCNAGLAKIEREWINSGEHNVFKLVGHTDNRIQWQFRTQFTEWTDIPGATEATYVTPPIHVAMDEVIYVRAKVTCANGGVAFSDEASFKVRGNSLLRPIDAHIAHPQLFNPAFRQAELLALERNQSSGKTALVYPTVSRDFVKIRFNASTKQAVKIYIVNSLGSVVYQTNQDQMYEGEELELAVNQFAPGTYFIKIESGQQADTQRIIVQ